MWCQPLVRRFYKCLKKHKTGLVIFGVTITSADAQRLPLLDFTQEDRAEIGYFLPASERDDLFNRLYPQNNDRCEESLQGEMNAVNGSFTKADSRETVVAFTSWTECSHSGQHGNIVLLNGQTIILWNNTLEAEVIEASGNFANNGLHQVVVSYTDGGQGNSHTETSTLSFRDSKISIIDFVNGTVDKKECSSDDGTEYAAIFYKNNGYVLQENFTKKCGEERQSFKFYSRGKLN